MERTETLEEFVNRTIEERKVKRQHERAEREAQYKIEEEEYEELIRIIDGE